MKRHLDIAKVYSEQINHNFRESENISIKQEADYLHSFLDQPTDKSISYGMLQKLNIATTTATLKLLDTNTHIPIAYASDQEECDRFCETVENLLSNTSQEINQIKHLYVAAGLVVESAEQNPSATDDEMAHYILDTPSPRLRFLFAKKRYLENLLAPMKEKQAEMRKIVEETPTEEPPAPSKISSFFKTIATGFSKIIDTFKLGLNMIDDVWYAFIKILPADLIEKVGPMIAGGAGFIIHAVEGIESAKSAYKAWHAKGITAQNVRIITGIFASLTAGAGFGLSVALFVAQFGAVVAGVAFMPVLISGLLAVICGANLYKHYAIKQELVCHAKIAKEELVKITKELNEIHIELKNIHTVLKNSHIDIENSKTTHTLLSKKFSLEAQAASLAVRLAETEENYLIAKEKELKAERKLAFTSIEMITSLVVMVGFVLGVSAIMGAATVASLGVLPTAILAVGAGVGIAVKIFELIDKKVDHAYTSRIRMFGTDLWKKFKLSVSDMMPKPKFSTPTVAQWLVPRLPQKPKLKATSLPEITHITAEKLNRNPITNSAQAIFSLKPTTKQKTAPTPLTAEPKAQIPCLQRTYAIESR